MWSAPRTSDRGGDSTAFQLTAISGYSFFVIAISLLLTGFLRKLFSSTHELSAQEAGLHQQVTELL